MHRGGINVFNGGTASKESGLEIRILCQKMLDCIAIYDVVKAISVSMSFYGISSEFQLD